MFRNTKNRAVLALALVFPSLVQAAIGQHPVLKNCHAVKTVKQEKSIRLAIRHSAKKQRLYLLRNRSDRFIWVDHKPNRDPGVSAGWETELSPNKWSALALDHNNFPLHCGESKPGTEETLSCANVLEICEVSSSQFNDDTAGSYWVAENKKLPDLLQDIKARGIKI